MSEAQEGVLQRQRQRKCLLKKDWKIKFEFAILVTEIAIVWGLSSLPIVFYHLSSVQVVY